MTPRVLNRFGRGWWPFLCCAVFLSVFAYAAALPSQAQAARNNKYASIVIDADTGMVLHQRYADKVLHPASLTKMMTLLMTFEALKSGRLQQHEKIRISRHAASMVPSKLDLPAGSSIRVDHAVYALVTKSANDVAVALAEKLAGSEARFAAAMTRRARQIGMSRTVFRNASGLHDPEQVSTARDMARLGRYIIRAYPAYYRVFSRRSFTYDGKTHNNHNRLMTRYEGMDGIKTGYISAAGFNLVASARRGNARLIGVVFGGRSARTRNAHMKDLLDRGFSRIKTLQLAGRTAPVPPRKPSVILAMGQLGRVLGASYQPSSGGGQAQARPAAGPTLLAQVMGGERLDEVFGQGDYDPDQARRLETGYMALAAHTDTPELGRRMDGYLDPDEGGGKDKDRTRSLSPEAYKIPSRQWSAQIGAFRSRAQTDRALRDSYGRIADILGHARPIIVPKRQSPGNWLFRARLAGLSQGEAEAACRRIANCITVAPGE